LRFYHEIRGNLEKSGKKCTTIVVNLLDIKPL
jgi:hypothetical protein